MKTYLSRLWATQPVLVTLIGSGAFWSLLFEGLAAFGHPLTTAQQTFLSAIGTLIATAILHPQVVPASGATLPLGTVITAPARPATAPTTAIIGLDAAPFAVIQAAEPAPTATPTPTERIP